MIEINDVSFSYGSKPVFRHASLQLRPGELLSILGPNGAGKTTLLNTIAGLLLPQSGEILYEGKPHKRISARERARLVGYVPQAIVAAFDYSVLEFVVTGCAPRIGTLERPKKQHYDTAMEAIRTMGIEHLAEKSYKQISGGERQQVTIARVIAQKPRFILMDEPTAHLDYGNQIHVLKIISKLAQEGFSVALTTHNPDHVLLLGGRVAVLNREGELRSGDCDAIFTPDFLSTLYKTELRLATLGDMGRKLCYSPGLDR